MKCPKCQFENREGVDFCEECGTKLELECPNCKAKIPLGRKFCGKCGSVLEPISEPSPEPEKSAPYVPSPPADTYNEDVISKEGERKYVTVLFSDMSGYTAMSENLDPEDVKEITSHIFEKISKIVTQYEGFIEKFIGDAVMAVFGATKSHEDDPIRAVKAAMDIHRSVESINIEYQGKIKEQVSMHSGINTGLVVTGKIDMQKGTHGLSGDTINLAARLSSLGEKGDILVGSDTYAQAEGFFDFEKLAPRTIKGKAKPVQIYRLLTQKDQPRKIHRLQGVRAQLIGRKVEMVKLQSALNDLQQGAGSIFAIYGTAGTGKSRLIEEFKASLDLERIQWIEGFAYPYTQNIPYYPLINLLSRAFQIKEGDPQHTVKDKIEAGVTALINQDRDLIPYIGGLFSLSYPELENVSPDFWMSQIEKATRLLLYAIAHRGPAIICLEDLHWADPSFLKLIRAILCDTRDPIMFICVYRPLISLFSSHQIKGMVNPYHEIELKDLSASDSQDMVESLLNTSNVPPELNQFIQEKIEGNPFYLEELVNSLMETGTLVVDDTGWHLTRTIAESEISSTIHGVIAARLDRLKNETKRVLQEASVIGRAFYFDILKRITDLSENIEQHLSGLERLDLIKARSIEPDLEYMFKHALTQEVVYNGLLIKERLKIHARIAHVIEKLFADRLPEFYETLAFHYKQSNSVLEAVNYLMKAGEKSLKRYAVQEAHEYYKDAYRLMMDNPANRKDNRDLFYSLLNNWSLVYYYRGDFKGQTDILKLHEAEAAEIQSNEIKAMFYGWLGFNLTFRKELEDSYRYLQKALLIGKEIKNLTIVGYAYTWLAWLCAGMDRYEEAYSYREKAIDIAKTIESDQYLFFKSLGSICHITMFSGRKTHCHDAGIQVLDFGKRHSNTRSQVIGHLCIGHSHNSVGNHQEALQSYLKALEIATDPFYTEWARFSVGMSYFMSGNLEKAEESLIRVAAYIEKCGCETMISGAYPILGAIMISKGKMSEGLDMIMKCYRSEQEKKWGYGMATGEYTLAKVYAQITQGEEKPKMSVLAKNLKFIVRNVPFAFNKAEEYFKKAIETAKQYQAQGLLGQSYYDLGQLYLSKNKQSQARECFCLAENVFKELDAEIYLTNTQSILKSLG